MNDKRNEANIKKSWYQKESILAAVIGGIFTIVAAIITVYFSSVPNDDESNSSKVTVQIPGFYLVSVDDYVGINFRKWVLTKEELEQIENDKLKNPEYLHSSYIGFLKNGHEIKVLNHSGGWYEIETNFKGKKRKGYISDNFKGKPTIRK